MNQLSLQTALDLAFNQVSVINQRDQLWHVWVSCIFAICLMYSRILASFSYNEEEPLSKEREEIALSAKMKNLAGLCE